MPRTPQFASTPRFLLSQRGVPPSSLSATRPPPEGIDEDDSPQNTPLAKRVRGRPFAATASASRYTSTPHTTVAKDVIEDSEDDGSALSQDSEMEAEYEALFGEKEPGSTAKRRRVGDEDEQDEMNEDHNIMDNDGEDDDDDNVQADYQDDQPPTDWHDNGNATPQQEHNHNPDQESYSDENVPSSSLESPSKAQLPNPTPNFNRPRFLLSASSQLRTPSQSYSHPTAYPLSSTKQQQTYPIPSQSIISAPARIAPGPETTLAPGTMTAPPPPSSIPPPSTRRKPTFVLPRSPSPDTAADDFLPLFSPSRTQRRGGRGRPRVAGQGQGYVPGGMAEQVRGWVLEMGVKGNTRSGQEQHYSFVVQVEETKRSSMGSCGELTFVRGTEVHTDDDPDGGGGVVRNLLLMGAPLSRRMNFEEREKDGVLELQKGDCVGVGQWLVWDVELESMQEDRSETEKWEVCMEWDAL